MVHIHASSVIAEAARIKIYSSRTFFSLILYCSSTLYNLKLEVSLESFANSYSVPTLAHDNDRDSSETSAKSPFEWLQSRIPLIWGMGKNKNKSKFKQARFSA